MNIQYGDAAYWTIALTVNHYFAGAEKAFSEAGQPENHVYHKLLRLHDLVTEIETENEELEAQ